MFNLPRYFLTLSFVLVVLAAGVLGPLYRNLSLQQMNELAEARNLAMATVFDNAYRQKLNDLLLASSGLDAAQLRQSAGDSGLQMASSQLFAGSEVIKVKLYNRLGITVFSTEAAQIGDSRLDNGGFKAAMNGGVFSELTHRGEMAAFDRTLREVDVFATYLPLRSPDQTVNGVIEIYQDVTPHFRRLNFNQWLMFAGVFAAFALLYLGQFVVVRRGQGILEEQEGRIKAACETLEIQVAARTDELKRINTRLEAEIGERRQAESKLNYLAYHDPLTGLANRRCFIERLQETMGETARRDLRLAVLFIDLDQFAQVNDTLGHVVGDELLVAVAARLSEHVRLIDMLARLGGDEFICLMEALRDEEDVAVLAGEIIGAFESPFLIGDHELFLSASVGIALYPGDGESVVDLMRNADTAMYRAKAAGRGQSCFYSPEMTATARERARMENLLRRALDQGELAVHLQPQVRASDGQLVGAEALVRWQSQELGQVPPVRFIPLAEETGLIIPLGEWVLRESCLQVMQWQLADCILPMLSVNVSVRQLQHPGFVASLSAILSETGLPPQRLKLELTESVVMAVEGGEDILERLRDLGIQLAIDDFGTGYSSLSYLKMLPVQQLKIVRSFVTGIGENTGDEAIIRTVIELAQRLGFEVVAEGVETEAQATFLAGLGCYCLQGYLHGRAVPPEDFRNRWLRPS